MAIDYRRFIHPTDKVALDALKALPGFDLIVKAFMEAYGEQLFKIRADAAYLRLGPDQMPEIYEILLRVCERLEIPVPALYLSLDRTPNATTMGETNVFIVLTSGLIETMTNEQIETVIAHECGHIICHHCFYTAIASYVIDFADELLKSTIASSLLKPLQLAFKHWERCSELSADRVAGYYHNSPNQIIDVMLAFSGGTNNLKFPISREAFIKQARDYKEETKNLSYNKLLEFIQFGKKDHPPAAKRAYEILDFFENQKLGTIETPKLQSPESSSLITKTSISKIDPNTPCYRLTICYEYIESSTQVNDIVSNQDQSIALTLRGGKIILKPGASRTFCIPASDYMLQFDKGAHYLRSRVELNKDKKVTIVWDAEKKKMSLIK